MNKATLVGRLSKDVETRYSQGANPTAVSRTSIAVDRKIKREGEPEADFFNLVAFGKTAEFLEKYFHRGMKIAISGRIENDNYTDKDGRKVYGTRIVVEECEFCDSKDKSSNATEKPQNNAPQSARKAEGFMNVPEGLDEELPFN